VKYFIVLRVNGMQDNENVIHNEHRF